MAASDPLYDRITPISVTDTTRAMENAWDRGMQAEFSGAAEFRGHMVAFADESDHTIAVIKDIGKLILSDNLRKNERKELNKLLKEYNNTISAIIQKQATTIDVSDPERNRFLLCALQINRICLETLYRGSLPSTTEPEGMPRVLSHAMTKMAGIREAKLAQVQVVCGEAIHHEISQLTGQLKTLCEAYTATFLPENQSIQIEPRFDSPSSEDESAKEALIDSRSKIIGELEVLSDRLENFGIPKQSLQINLTSAPEEVHLQMELIKNKLVNNQLFLGQTKKFIDENKFEIVKQLRPDLRHDQEIVVRHVGLHDTLTETHNGGRAPVVIRLDVGGTEVKCLLKPRRADIDKAVINTFRALNDQAVEGSRGYPLPDYVIIQPEQNQQWHAVHGLGEVSLWQFIEGETVRKAYLGDDYSKKTNANEYANSFRNLSMREPLRKMAAIFANMQIVDQHQDNILVTHMVDGKPTINSRLVPIDLEVRGRGRSELGVSKNDYIALSDQEIHCIQRHFHDELVKIQPITRIVLVSTEDLLYGLRGCVYNPQHISTVVEKIRTNFGEEYKLISAKKLLHHFIEDFLNDDVPYLTEKEGLLYYGTPDRGIVIGSKR